MITCTLSFHLPLQLVEEQQIIMIIKDKIKEQGCDL